MHSYLQNSVAETELDNCANSATICVFSYHLLVSPYIRALCVPALDFVQKLGLNRIFAQLGQLIT